jgi:hypothetical protein
MARKGAWLRWVDCPTGQALRPSPAWPRLTDSRRIWVGICRPNLPIASRGADLFWAARRDDPRQVMFPAAGGHSALSRLEASAQTAARDERRRGRPAFVLFMPTRQPVDSFVGSCGARLHTCRCARSAPRRRLGLRSAAVRAEGFEQLDDRRQPASASELSGGLGRPSIRLEAESLSGVGGQLVAEVGVGNGDEALGPLAEALAE